MKEQMRIVFCWELGGGLGHLGPLQPVVRSLQELGCETAVISRNDDAARKLFAHCGAGVYQAPTGTTESERKIESPSNYAHVLHNNGWCDQQRLEKLVTRWRELLVRTQPDLVICDHSPTALLAAHTLALPAASFGTGFCCPPPTSPLPSLRPQLLGARSQPDVVESRLLNRMNQILDGHDRRTFNSFADLFHRETHHFLTSFRELDHYQQRPLTRYWGTWSLPGGRQPRWPNCDAKYRAVAYLKPFLYLSELLSILVYQGVSLLVYCPEVDPQIRARLSAQQRIHFSTEPVDLRAALSQCDFAIFNAGHGSTAGALLAGKPMLQVPLNLEQSITAQRISAMGAGRAVDAANPLGYSQAVEDMLDLKPHQHAARSFANRYQRFHSETQIESLAATVIALAGGAAGSGGDSVAALPPSGADQEVLIGLSPSESMLSKIVSHFAGFPGAAVQRQALRPLPWDADRASDAELQTRLESLTGAYPGVPLVGDIGVSYLPYVKRLASLELEVSFLCVYISAAELVAECLEAIAVRAPGRSINHWSEDRSGFDDHPLDHCYPTYPTRDLVTAITRFHSDYFSKAKELAVAFPERFQQVDSETLTRIRHTAVSQADSGGAR